MTLPGNLEFLRPAWLLALLALPLFPLLARRAARAASAWRDAIDPHLLPHLLERGSRRGRGRMGAWLAALAWALAALALAGPSWREVEQPLWQTRLPTVIALDLSSAALASDLPPTRLAQARARLEARLGEHPGGPLALVVYAGDAFTVAPLTEDVANIALFLDALEPGLMPVDGQAADRAIAWSRELMQRAGAPRGQIVLLTDRADASARSAAAEARAAGYTVSAIGLGTPRGARVRTLSGRDAEVALDAASLRALAEAGGGRYARLGDGDARAFSPPGAGAGSAGRGSLRLRQDGGYWLLPAVMLFALLAWLRPARGLPVVLLLACIAQPAPVRAADAWRRDDQRTHAQVLQGIEAYRRRDYERAADLFARGDGAIAHYNRGNALAKAGRLDEAVAAYDEALRRAPAMEDARANRDAVQAAMRRQRAGGGQTGNDRQGGAPQQGDRKSRRSPQADGDGAAQGGQGQQQAPPDADAQARADAAQRARMQAALEAARARQAQQAPGARRDTKDAMSPQERERRLSNDAALRRIPDDPGSLLREKFRLEYERRQRGGGR